MIIDRLHHSIGQYTLQPRLDRALRFLRNTDVAARNPGRHDLEGEEIFALVQAYDSKPPDQGNWEAHLRYIDVQYVVQGNERLGWAPLAAMQPRDAYNPERDIRYYTGSGDLVTLREGFFAILFPDDVHMPGMAIGLPAPIRKVVVKVAVE